MSGVHDPLEHELAFYDRHKSEWLPFHENHFVVVAGDTLLGFYEDYASAWEAGAQRLGPQANFLIKQVCSHEPVYFLY